MFSADDTIVAIATPPGRGGIGVVRVSGPEASEVAGRVIERRAPLCPRRATLTRVRLQETVDQVVVTWFPGPGSYTGQHVVEISAHGSPVILESLVDGLVRAGARLARPGEFTLRAFLAGRLDLVQAEAVGDLIEAATPLQARVAFDQLEGTLSARIAAIDTDLLDLVARLEASLDFPEEGFHFIEPGAVAARIEAAAARIDAVVAHAARGRMIREGATVAIVGRPNVGKSSLFNALVGQDRAIVSDTPGTTRDLVTERVSIEGLAVTLVDTAGVREARETVERAGVERALRAGEAADLVLAVLDCGEALTEEDRGLVASRPERSRVLVANKADREPRWTRADAIRVSALTGVGLDDLRRAVADALTGGGVSQDGAPVTNLRHVTLLRAAHDGLQRAGAAVADGAPEEFVRIDLPQARRALAEVVGTSTSDDLLREIFDRFCIGK
jgi:tRNA modification GTPase